MNPIYEFNDPNHAIVIKKHDLPHPWINYLSNGSMHAIVSQAGGGFAWWKSAVSFRLTKYRAHNLPMDTPGFYIYIRCSDGTTWSPTFLPCETKLDDWSAQHQPGRTTFIAKKDQLECRLSLYIVPDHDILVWDVAFENSSAQALEFDVTAYAELSQMSWEGENNAGYYNLLQLKAWYDADINGIFYDCHNYHTRQDDLPLVFFSSSEVVSSYCCDRQAFVGDYRYERNPIAIENNHLGNVNLPIGHPCAALHHKVKCAAHGNKKFNFFLGLAPGATADLEKSKQACLSMYREICRPAVLKEQEQKLGTWWQEHLDVFQCSIPNREAERQINIWTPINTVHTGRYSRSVNSWAPGFRGLGFRDSCQDMMAVAYRKPKWAEEMLALLLSYQYEDGHVVHCAFPEDRKEPWTSIHSDDHLWLPLLAYAIAAESGDYRFLKKEVSYLSLEHRQGSKLASIWQHLLDTIRFTESRIGEFGIPLTLKSDWNDIIGRYNKRGKGQTVFAGQQYVVALKNMSALAKAIGDIEALEWLEDCCRRQVQALLACAWDGKWWRRGFDDDGHAVGSDRCDAGKLYLNPQSWSVLSGVGTREQMLSGMQACADQLDTGIGLKILTPGFSSWSSGKSNSPLGYGPGCGENGAIFCHANTWAIMAEALLGNGTRAWKYFNQLVPHNALQKVGISRYQAEPYAWVSNIVGPENEKFGYANVEQVTGTATWMDVAATQYLLGLRPEMTGLLVDPCIPAAWDEFSLTRQYRGCLLNIHIRNPKHVEKGVVQMLVDGKAVELSEGPLVRPHHCAGKTTVKISIVLGDGPSAV